MRSSDQVAGLLFLALVGAATAGCDDSEGGSKTGPSDGLIDPATSGSDPLYAMLVQVYSDDDRTVYVHLTDTLDFGKTVDLSKSREFAGVANFAPIGGKLLVSSGLEPTITAFEISKDLQWHELNSISFANYPFEDNANFFSQYVLDDNTVYMPWDVTKRLIWDPSKMEIRDMRDDSTLPLKDGALDAKSGGNRNAIKFKGPVQQPFFYSDKDYTTFGAESIVAIYDEKTHAEKSLVKLPCPAAAMASQDEQGYTYYGTWSFQVKAVFGEGPKPCVARLKPDLTLDEAWTTDLKDMTGGRHHNNFRYIGKGRAIANVLHTELLNVPIGTTFDATTAEKIEESGPHWRLWLLDLNKREGKPVEGIDLATTTGSQFAVLDGRTFVFVPYDDWGRTKIFEIADDGTAKEHADTTGDVFKWVKVR